MAISPALVGKHKVISSTACNAAEMNSGTSSGRSLTLASELRNNRRVCFAVKDTSDNWAYLASGLIIGIDRTAPSIAVSSVTDNKVNALASDTNSPTLESLLISHTTCSSSTAGTFETYTAGTDLTLPAGFRACFKATDSVGNVSYVSSGVGVAVTVGDGRDTVDPVESVDDMILPIINISTVANNKVSATLTGDLSNFPVLEFQIISDNVCSDSAGGTFEAYTPGSELTLPVGSRACFKVTDNAGRTAYAVSAAGRKRKKSTQRESNTPPSAPQQPQLEVSVLTGETLSAADNYDAGATTMFYRIQSDDACAATHEGAFNAYQEGTALSLTVNDDYYVCFKAVDNDDSNNVAYSVSALIVVEPPPEPVDPDDSASEDPPDSDNSNGETGIDPLPAPLTSDPEPDPVEDSASGSAESDDDETETDPPASTSDSDDTGGSSSVFTFIGLGLLVVALVLAAVKGVFKKT